MTAKLATTRREWLAGAGLAAMAGGWSGRAWAAAATGLLPAHPEPLPPAHPLWTTPNCFITPHSAGGFSLEKERHVRHFLENLRRFERGEAMLDRIY